MKQTESENTGSYSPRDATNGDTNQSEGPDAGQAEPRGVAPDSKLSRESQDDLPPPDINRMNQIKNRLETMFKEQAGPKEEGEEEDNSIEHELAENAACIGSFEEINWKDPFPPPPPPKAATTRSRPAPRPKKKL